MTHESPNTDPWRYRRRFLMMYSAFVMVIVIRSVFSEDMDPEVAKVVISSGLMSLGGVVSAYVFGAAWERKEMEKP